MWRGRLVCTGKVRAFHRASVVLWSFSRWGKTGFAACVKWLVYDCNLLRIPRAAVKPAVGPGGDPGPRFTKVTPLHGNPGFHREMFVGPPGFSAASARQVSRMGGKWGNGGNDLGDFLDFSCIVNNMLLYFWGLYYSKMAN